MLAVLVEFGIMGRSILPHQAAVLHVVVIGNAGSTHGLVPEFDSENAKGVSPVTQPCLRSLCLVSRVAMEPSDNCTWAGV